MKYYMANTYQTGNIIVRAKNRTDVIEYLNSLDLDVYSISTLNAYCNDVYGEDVTIIIEFQRKI